MTISNTNSINIIDLPNELLFIILNKLKRNDVLYSLVDVHSRFDRLIFDSVYLYHHFNITAMDNSTIYDETSSLDTQVIRRISDKTLPSIHDQIHKLTVEQDSMKEVLSAAKYHHLYSLSIVNSQEDILYQYLTDDSILRHYLTDRITHLYIDFKKPIEFSKTVVNIFVLILSLCKQLIEFNFGNMFFTRNTYSCITYLYQQPHVCSTLTKLTINVTNFHDCLTLLDGRLESLITLIIKVRYVFDLPTSISRMEKLPKLKCFSLTAWNRTDAYYSAIIPSLRRMIKLEELKLYLVVDKDSSTFIDGYELYDKLVIYMNELKNFSFNIKTIVSNIHYSNELLLNNYIRDSFIRECFQQVNSYIRMESMKSCGMCRVYSLPYEFEYFFDLEHCFPGGMFHNVRQLTMNDSCPFEYKLFQSVARDFPCLESLSISNRVSNGNDQNSFTSMMFPCLMYLDLENAHDDYVKLFLLRKTTHLPRLLNLIVNYKSLIIITNHYTKDPVDFNFGTVKTLDLGKPCVCPENFHHYFPLLQIV